MGKNPLGLPKQESEITDALVPFVQAMFQPPRGRELVVLPELSIDNGVADLGAFVVRSSRIQRRLRAGILQSFATPSKAAIIAPFVRFHALRRNTLFHRSGLLAKNFQTQLKSLQADRAVQYVKNRGVFLLNPNMRPAIEESIAIEAKTEDWATALYQASRYASFARKCFVALSFSVVHRALKHVERFRASRVGLIAVDPDIGKCEILLSYTRKKPTSSVGTVIANEKVFARYVGEPRTQ